MQDMNGEVNASHYYLQTLKKSQMPLILLFSLQQDNESFVFVLLLVQPDKDASLVLPRLHEFTRSSARSNFCPHKIYYISCAQEDDLLEKHARKKYPQRYSSMQLRASIR